MQMLHQRQWQVYNSSTKSTQIKKLFIQYSSYMGHPKESHQKSWWPWQLWRLTIALPGTPHTQQTSPSLPQTGRGWLQQHPTLGATTTKVTNPQNSYVEGLPRPPHTIPTMPSLLILSTMMTATHNQSPQHLTPPWYKSGKSSAPSLMTSSLNSLNPMQNMTTQTRIKQMLPAPYLPAALAMTTTKWWRTITPPCFFTFLANSNKSILSFLSSSNSSKTLLHARIQADSKQSAATSAMPRTPVCTSPMCTQQGSASCSLPCMTHWWTQCSPLGSPVATTYNMTMVEPDWHFVLLPPPAPDLDKAMVSIGKSLWPLHHLAWKTITVKNKFKSKYMVAPCHNKDLHPP